jgi:hypothetical protein
LINDPIQTLRSALNTTEENAARIHDEINELREPDNPGEGTAIKADDTDFSRRAFLFSSALPSLPVSAALLSLMASSLSIPASFLVIRRQEAKQAGELNAIVLDTRFIDFIEENRQHRDIPARLQNTLPD